MVHRCACICFKNSLLIPRMFCCNSFVALKLYEYSLLADGLMSTAVTKDTGYPVCAMAQCIPPTPLNSSSTLRGSVACVQTILAIN